MHDAADTAEVWLRANDPIYLKSRQGWRNFTRLDRDGNLDYQAPFLELAAGGVVVETWCESGVPGFDYQLEYEKRPNRKKDRHKGSRAAYMRTYRARRRGEAEADSA